MRDHRKLDAFCLSDRLVEQVYELTREFPRAERFSLTSQFRRAAISVPGNIVEGCARHSDADLFRFLDYAFGSLRETGYYLDLSGRLGFGTDQQLRAVTDLQEMSARKLGGLLKAVRRWE